MEAWENTDRNGHLGSYRRQAEHVPAVARGLRSKGSEDPCQCRWC